MGHSFAISSLDAHQVWGLDSSNVYCSAMDGEGTSRPNYQFEVDRLQSYRNWPTTSRVDPVNLAKAGFYYTGENDTVRCFECNVAFCSWCEGDNPLADHRQWSSRCRFVRNTIPEMNKPRDGMLACDNLSHRFSQLNRLGLIPAQRPVYPHLTTYSARLKTFDEWPTCMVQDKRCLAEAGFFYSGQDDRICCYHCNVCLREWQRNDDPWKEHAKRSPHCYFMLIMKGLVFVNQAIGQKPLAPLTNEVSVF